MFNEKSLMFNEKSSLMKKVRKKVVSGEAQTRTNQTRISALFHESIISADFGRFLKIN